MAIDDWIGLGLFLLWTVTFAGAWAAIGPSGEKIEARFSALESRLTTRRSLIYILVTFLGWFLAQVGGVGLLSLLLIAAAALWIFVGPVMLFLGITGVTQGDWDALLAVLIGVVASALVLGPILRGLWFWKAEDPSPDELPDPTASE